MESFETADRMLADFKGNAYLHGLNVLDQAGSIAAELGKSTVLIADRFPGSSEFVTKIKDSLATQNVAPLAEVAGAAPNCPREDLYRITRELDVFKPDVIISFGGGSTIDAAKAAALLYTQGGIIDDYFGTGLVTQAVIATEKKLIPHVAIQTAASSSAHLTKYANITDMSTGQKKLVVDNAIIPARPVFDYSVTFGSPPGLTADGALDGVSHALEVLYSAAGKPGYERIEAAACECIRLIVNHLPKTLADPQDAEARQALGLATDLGGYCIMLGGTNGAHLTSFSLVDILSHGRACGMLNPYYTVFFAPAVEAGLRKVTEIYRTAGYTTADPAKLSGRALGMAAALAMIAFEQAIGFPTRLEEVPGFTEDHIRRALAAAKDPQLKMKLENMPIPMTTGMVDEYMGPILQAARTGNLELIQNLA